MTKVVVIGGGGREHALVRALRRGGGNREIVAIPGNPGIAREARCVPAQPSLADAALAESPDLVVLAAGVLTPRAAVFEDPAAAREHARHRGACVVKLDGLAAGKGVIVADDG